MTAARARSQTPLVLTGRAASPGFVAGPVVTLATSAPAGAVAGAPGDERARLGAALGGARAALAVLIAGLEDEAARGIVEFQLALIEDDALIDAAFAALSPGVAAEEAWRRAIAPLIADYEAAEDEYFRARASDLADIRERVLRLLAGGAAEPAALPPGAVVVAPDLPPTRFLALDWQGRGIALVGGSPTSHVATLARARGVPMIVGLGAVAAADGEEALLDAHAGTLTVAPDRRARAAFAARSAADARSRDAAARLLAAPSATVSGERVLVLLNVADPAELDAIAPATVDGIGLVRTEFLFHGHDRLPDEEEQLAVYRRLLAWAGGRPVTIRTLDAGGDKPIPGLTAPGESNPFLGLRGVRLSLARPDVFRVQLRALLRAAPEGDLHVMIPMVSVPREMDQVRALMSEVAAELERERVPHAWPRLGMMVEVPAAALTLELFETDFVSIGSNDLTQYVMAAGRDCAAVASLADAANAAVLRLVAETVRVARARGIKASLCGDAGGDPRLVPHLLAAGLRALSVAPAAIGRTKLAIAGWSG